MGLSGVSDSQSTSDVENSNTFTCPICFDICPRSTVFVPSGCTHEFCHECARSVVLNAVRSLDFPIDCPLCKIATADSEDEEEASSEPSSQQHSTLTTVDRAHSEHVMSHIDAVDPNHAMQLHASHSTPSLEIIAATQHSSPDVAGSSRLAAGPLVSSQQRNDDSKGFAANKAKHMMPAISIHANTAKVGFASVDTLADSELDQSRSSQHHVTSPSFPIIVTGTPNTPSLIPTDPLPHQGSHTLFSPHQPTHVPQLTHGTVVSQTPSLSLSGVSVRALKDNMEADDNRAQRDLAGRDLPLSEQMSIHSVSLGDVMTAPRGVTRGLSSPADWMTAVPASVSRSSSTSSLPLSRGGSRGRPQVMHSRRGSLDADVHMLLTHEEEKEYLSKSLKAAAHRYGSLVQCPKPNCEGVASLQEGDPHFECPQCGYEWCRECQRDWHPATRCQDATGEKCVSRYIPKKPTKKKGHRRGGSGCVSMGGVGSLIKDTMKRFGSMDIMDAEVSLNRYLKRNRVLECPQCRNGITKLDGGCNHIMCAVCKTHICWLCGVKICQGVNNYWDANRHFWIKGTPCYGQIQAELK